jgi:hypothetical protein
MYEYLEILSEKLIGLQMVEIIISFLINIYGFIVVDDGHFLSRWCIKSS